MSSENSTNAIPQTKHLSTLSVSLVDFCSLFFHIKYPIAILNRFRKTKNNYENTLHLIRTLPHKKVTLRSNGTPKLYFPKVYQHCRKIYDEQTKQTRGVYAEIKTRCLKASKTKKAKDAELIRDNHRLSESEIMK